MPSRRSSNVELFRKKFRRTRSSNGFWYSPETPVGKWQRVRFWIGGESTSKGWPACVYRSEKEGSGTESRSHYFRTAFDAYAAMLSWAERQGWELALQPSRPSAALRVPPIPEEMKQEIDFDLILSFEDGDPISVTNAAWHGAKEWDDWDPEDWERHASRAEPDEVL